MYQKVILIGRVGQKQLGYTKTQKPVAQYSLATTKSFKDKQTGDWNEHTEWHRLVSFNQCAEHVNNKLEPGDLIQVEGELRTRKWQDQNGQDRYTTEVVLQGFNSNLTMLDGRSSGGGSFERDGGGMSERGGSSGGQSYELDDDIPF